jgi:hypothetical protein
MNWIPLDFGTHGVLRITAAELIIRGGSQPAMVSLGSTFQRTAVSSVSSLLPQGTELHATQQSEAAFRETSLYFGRITSGDRDHRGAG